MPLYDYTCIMVAVYFTCNYCFRLKLSIYYYNLRTIIGMDLLTKQSGTVFCCSLTLLSPLLSPIPDLLISLLPISHCSYYTNTGDIDGTLTRLPGFRREITILKTIKRHGKSKVRKFLLWNVDNKK